jgi:nucleoside 2-deoxyribosyltransferase
MSTDNKCIFCDNKCDVNGTPNYHLLDTFSCDYCGVYILPKIGLSAVYDIQSQSDKFKIACILNERRLKKLGGIALKNKTDKEKTVCGYPMVSIEDILDEFPKKASDFLNRTLLNLSRLPERPFDVIILSTMKAGDRLHFFTHDKIACNAFLRELEEQGFIRFNIATTTKETGAFFLTTKFWEIVENLQKEEIGNKRAFVAMWFDESMNVYYENGIKKAIEDAGYEPVRIDLQDFNEKICDEIIAEIKRTKFLIADFSGLRSGVFFEAGFAKGLGREVIFTVRETDVEKLKEHFDTRQYNHIVYDTPEDLYKKLFNRICATIV